VAANVLADGSGNDWQHRPQECKSADQQGAADGFQHFDMSGNAAGRVSKRRTKQKTYQAGGTHHKSLRAKASCRGYTLKQYQVTFPDASKSSGFGGNSCTIPAAPAPPKRRQMRRLFVDETREYEARGAIRALKQGKSPQRRSLAIAHHPTDPSRFHHGG
jgi:hypothetical protein